MVAENKDIEKDIDIEEVKEDNTDLSKLTVAELFSLLVIIYQFIVIPYF